MDEKDILERIRAFVDEERELRARHEHESPSDAEEHRRLKELEVALDQCWDLLRQRRARVQAGQNPDDAQVRPASQVENYRQ
ncbi:DUF2630 family protein [Actinomadura rugatobispora]|uniref:DUF2630 family protein n=1 Tax=Actinomadura rugatobispora TaxID=1994 RepID=A0ABW1A8F3_9ACTN|nr:DUF2630 family protein [Actinomadura rugatobispora]